MVPSIVGRVRRTFFTSIISNFFFFFFFLFRLGTPLCEKVRLSRPMRPPDFDPPPNPTVTPTILQARWIFADRMGDEEVGPDLVQCQLSHRSQ